jgi:dodecin
LGGCRETRRGNCNETLRDLRVAEVNKLDLVIVDGKVAAFRARVNLSFKYQEKD